MTAALDGIAHCLEVLYGAINNANYDLTAKIAEAGIGLVVENLPKVMKIPTTRMPVMPFVSQPIWADTQSWSAVPTVPTLPASPSSMYSATAVPVP